MDSRILNQRKYHEKLQRNASWMVYMRFYAWKKKHIVLVKLFPIASILWRVFILFFYSNFPKLFDSSPSETKSEAKSEVDQSESVDEAQKLPEEVPLVPSHENLAFEEEEKHLEPKDTSMDSTTSTMDTTLDSTDTGDGSHDVQKGDNHSEISVSHVNGSDVSPTGSEGANEGSDYSMQSFLGNISSFAVQLTTVSAPEIKVDKPKTLFSVATEDSRYIPPPAPSQSPRRHTEHNINTNQVLNKSTLLPEAVTRRRHSDFAVAAPRPINEELAIEDLKKHGTQETSKSSFCKISNWINEESGLNRN